MFTFMEMLTSLVPLLTAAAVIIISPIVKEYIPAAIRNYLVSIYEKYFFTRQMTLIIESGGEVGFNEIYHAATDYLRTKIRDSSNCLKVSKSNRQEKLVFDLVVGEVISDDYKGIELKWNIKKDEPDSLDYGSRGKTVFNLSFDKKFKNMVLDLYLPYVSERYNKKRDAERAVMLYSRGRVGSSVGEWNPTILEHPATFDTLAMDPKLKTKVRTDLDRFVKRKELYKKVGKPWKRGYLIHGPPGTGKSSLIAAIANHLKFDIYDLKFSEIHSDSDLRRVLISTSNRSIMAIEDIDCGTVLDQPVQVHNALSLIPGPKLEITLSGLLNFIDGLWSSCGDERIIMFTTNHKDKLDVLDRALFRPGRVDMEVPMTYCTMDGFKLMASNYLDINYDDRFEKIEGLLKNKNVTPAEFSEELLKSDDKNVVLEGIVKFLEEKET